MSYGELRGAAALIWSVTGELQIFLRRGSMQQYLSLRQRSPWQPVSSSALSGLQCFPRSVAEALKEDDRTTGKAGAKSPLRALSWWAS
jgi:hypothetical protein